jgi:hypothetical protein
MTKQISGYFKSNMCLQTKSFFSEIYANVKKCTSMYHKYFFNISINAHNICTLKSTKIHIKNT